MFGMYVPWNVEVEVTVDPVSHGRLSDLSFLVVGVCSCSVSLVFTLDNIMCQSAFWEMGSLDSLVPVQ